MNSTLGSVVPLAMFLFTQSVVMVVTNIKYASNPQLFQKQQCFVNVIVIIHSHLHVNVDNTISVNLNGGGFANVNVNFNDNRNFDVNILIYQCDVNLNRNFTTPKTKGVEYN